jgi:hypothetical protein
MGRHQVAAQAPGCMVNRLREQSLILMDFTGTYCASFIANVKLQGSAQLNNGQDIQYNVTTQKIVSVSSINGSDGTPVVAGQTVAIMELSQRRGYWWI